MDEKEKTIKELMFRIEKLNNRIKELKENKKYGLVWDEEKEKENVVEECQYKLPILVNSTNIKVEDRQAPINFLIEGDNYHALSVLNYTHSDCIGFIYIDPPYNTGNKDFKYNDTFVEPENSYRHSKWLSFMSKRLKLAHNLLKGDGIMAISINNIEIAQLKLLCDGIFQEHNFIGTIIWRNKAGGGKQAQDTGKKEKKEAVNTDHEYILLYAKNISKIKKLNDHLSEEEVEEYMNPDNDPNGEYKLRDMEEGIPGVRPNNYYTITDPDGDKIKPAGGKYKWRFIESEFKRKLSEGSIIWVKKKCKKEVDARGYIYRPMVKQYLYSDGEQRTKILRSIFYDVAYTADGTRELKELFGENFNKFDFPKPIDLVKKLLAGYYSKDTIVLDFFAGTGTTGHAVLDLNKEDGGTRRFILCTNNEGGICTDVCFPRLKKVIEGYKSPLNGQIHNAIGGNLIYLKTDFVDVDALYHVSDEQRIDLTYRAGEMIALKENTFEEIEKNEWWQIFTDGTKHTAIYFKEDKSKLNKLIKQLSSLKLEVALYIFSWCKNEYANEFSEYKNIRVEDIPEPIIKVYEEINKRA